MRGWRSWHRHITLSMMAHAFLAWARYRATVELETTRKRAAGKKLALVSDLAIELTVPEVRRPMGITLEGDEGRRKFRLAWSRWRRRHQARAKRFHYLRRESAKGRSPPK